MAAVTPYSPSPARPPQAHDSAEGSERRTGSIGPGPVVLSVDGVTVHFGPRLALQDIHTNLRAAEIVSVVGPNGAGKSTLLKVLAGLLKPDHGRIQPSPELSQLLPAIVYVPQRSGANWAFPVSVLDVVLMGAPRGPWYSRLRPYSSAWKEVARQALKRVGMDAFANVQIGELSGGQQQRVFLARALTQDGQVYLLDEPFTGVDIPTQELLLEIFEELRSHGKTIVYATHDLGQASRSSSRVWLINHALIADGPPSDVMTLPNLHAAFGGQAVLVPTSGATTGTSYVIAGE